jgi:hypothetical protein
MQSELQFNIFVYIKKTIQKPLTFYYFTNGKK